MSRGDDAVFDSVMDTYAETWLDPMDCLLSNGAYFPAACLACVILDHLGTARRENRPVRGQHADEYIGFLRLLEPFGLPSDQSLKERIYKTLRNGLIHEGRTDDQQSEPETAERILLTHLDKEPEPVTDYGDFTLSVPWLCRAVRSVWTDLSEHADVSVRARIKDRLQIYYLQHVATMVASPSPGTLSSSTITPPASGSGPNFGGG